jgi:hypothetical protein
LRDLTPCLSERVDHRLGSARECVTLLAGRLWTGRGKHCVRLAELRLGRGAPIHALVRGQPGGASFWVRHQLREGTRQSPSFGGWGASLDKKGHSVGTLTYLYYYFCAAHTRHSSGRPLLFLHLFVQFSCCCTDSRLTLLYTPTVAVPSAMRCCVPQGPYSKTLLGFWFMVGATLAPYCSA